MTWGQLGFHVEGLQWHLLLPPVIQRKQTRCRQEQHWREGVVAVMDDAVRSLAWLGDLLTDKCMWIERAQSTSMLWQAQAQASLPCTGKPLSLSRNLCILLSCTSLPASHQNCTRRYARMLLLLITQTLKVSDQAPLDCGMHMTCRGLGQQHSSVMIRTTGYPGPAEAEMLVPAHSAGVLRHDDFVQPSQSALKWMRSYMTAKLACFSASSQVEKTPRVLPFLTA